MARCSFKVTVKDTKPPAITTPGDLEFECDANGGRRVEFVATAMDDCDGPITNLRCTPASGSLFPLGTNTVICRAVDKAGNSASKSFQIIVRSDATPPQLTTPRVVEASCQTLQGAPVEFQVSITDVCDPHPTLVCTPPSGSWFPMGSTTVKCVGTDLSGNSTTSTFPVRVSGNCDPACLAIQCPRDIDVALESGPAQLVAFNVMGTNTCTGTAVPAFCQPPSKSLFPIGTTVVDCAVKEGAVEKRCQFRVTVRDTEAPRFLLRRGFQVLAKCSGFNLQGVVGAELTFQVKAADNSRLPVTVTCDPPSGSFFRLGTNTVFCTATDAAGNRATTEFPVIVIPGPKCEVSAGQPELAPDNWGFELGLLGWKAEGSAFEYQPTRGDAIRLQSIPDLKQQLESKIGGDYWHDLRYDVGHKSDYWVCTAINTPFTAGGLFDVGLEANDSSTGSLISKPFIIEKDYLTFLIGGTEDPQKLRVELLIRLDAPQEGSVNVAGIPYRIEYWKTPLGRELMRRESFSMDVLGHRLLGKMGRIRILDQSTTGHINVDDFQFVDLHPLGQRIQLGGKEYPAVFLSDGGLYDWDSPVWGFADLHTHPMSHLGFAEKVMHGSPDGGPLKPTDLESALGDCRCSHGGWGLQNLCGDFLREAMMFAMDGKGNFNHREGWTSTSTEGAVKGANFEEYARFRNWPVFSTISHQQMWYEWIRRAYDGGLRVMVALCVNNPLLGSAAKGDGPIDDYTVGNNQIKALKEFVARHNDFMEIAYDPMEYRDIVRRNKLAIIIGSELDDIGNFAINRSLNENAPTEQDKAKVRQEIERLHGLGLRYMFPVHLMDNKFGGTPIVSPMLNMASKFLNGTPFKVENAQKDDRISFRLPERFDVLEELEKHQVELAIGASALPAIAPFLPILVDVLGELPMGTGAGLMPLAMFASVGLAGEFGEVIKAVPPDVWPVGNNYPRYAYTNAPFGHVNARGLTKLGEFAITEMMRLGIMIDVDHMSLKTINAVFELAEKNPVGYPLNSGHNSFRDQAVHHATENHRTSDQMRRIRDLGGLFGVGYENSPQHSVSDDRNWSVSRVENNCAGTSKSVSQTYLRALEELNGQGVALGTDINGLIAGPGPRFGPNSAFAREGGWNLDKSIRNQHNGVLYEPMHGRPIVGPVFNGHGVDPSQDYGWGRDEFLDNGNLHYGYTYSMEQRDLFPSIRIFYHFKEQVQKGMPETLVRIELAKIESALGNNYANARGDNTAPRIRGVAFGLLSGIKKWSIDNEADGTANGRLLYDYVFHNDYPKNLDPAGEERFSSYLGVWADYHEVFGKNTPLKRAKTGPKDWDINFDGVAHYGLLPDLFQDMKNVGMEAEDLDPLFHSADAFADMWTRCLAASQYAKPYFRRVSMPSTGAWVELLLESHDQSTRIEETIDVSDPNSWRLASPAEVIAEGTLRRVRFSTAGPARFFRIAE